MNRNTLIESLLNPEAYIHSVTEPVVLHETHISWVLLAGHFAYKIKKPIVTDFLDYGSLTKRHHACCEELRLGSRYASGLYLDVVPISIEDGQIRMDGDAQPIEFAVRMQRFDDDALLSNQLSKNRVSIENIVQLAVTIDGFHKNASKLDQPGSAIASKILDQAKQNCDLLLSEPLLIQEPMLIELEKWTTTYFGSHQPEFTNRANHGFIRECHGDLHCSNIVLWNGQWVPFDGIEFNSEYTWIDVISDVAFLVMDLKELGHPELSAAFLNAYLEETGDYQSISVLRWYLVYRALVRAKVALMRARQLSQSHRLEADQIAPAIKYIRLAKKLSESGAKKLWITHGVSGSGKTTRSQQIVQSKGAIRIRSDVERKRMFKTSSAGHLKDIIEAGIYSPTASEAMYQRLLETANTILQYDFSVIVDATFLKHADRKRFRDLAESQGAEFRILDCQADELTLKERITHRRSTSKDASDATLEVLANQLKNQELLTPEEREMAVFEGC